MMKRHLLLIFLLFYSCETSVKEPTNSTSGLLILKDNFCAYNAADSLEVGNNKIEIHNANEKQTVFVQNIIAYSGIDLDFRLYEGNVPNALATNINNKKYIIFNKDFLEDADNSSDTYWHTGFILAHEIAHHLYNHDFTSTDTTIRYKQELEADNFAGYLLYRLGADEYITGLIMKKAILETNGYSATHPKRSRRYISVINGWHKAYIQQYNIPVPPPPIFTTGEREEILSYFNDHSIDCKDFFTPSTDSAQTENVDPPSCTNNRNDLLDLYYSSDTLQGAIIKILDSKYEKPPLPEWLISATTIIRLEHPIKGYTDSLTNTLEVRLYQNPLFNSDTRGDGTNFSLNAAFRPGQKIKFKLLVYIDGIIPILYFSYLDFIPSK